MAYVRFPIPEFDHREFKDMEWNPPAFLSDADIKRLIERQKAGDASAWGGYPVMPSEAFFDKFKIKGERRHAVLCVLPSKPVKLLGRSHAWFVQRAVVTDSLDPGSCKTVTDWHTPRPINTRLGPDNGITVAGGVLYALCCRSYGEHWTGNRTMIDNAWKKGGGFRILSASVDDINDFHEVYLSFEWSA
jgi:hypothetical protein